MEMSERTFQSSPPFFVTKNDLSIEQVLATLLSHVHLSLPSAVDENGNKKEIYWKMSGLQVPVVRAPAGDNATPQVPLDIRLIRDNDFS